MLFFYHLTFLLFYLQLKEELSVSGSEEEADDPLCMESDEDLSDEVDKEIHDEVRIGGWATQQRAQCKFIRLYIEPTLFRVSVIVCLYDRQFSGNDCFIKTAVVESPSQLSEPLSDGTDVVIPKPANYLLTSLDDYKVCVQTIFKAEIIIRK